MADEVEWMLFEDGCLCINESICGITYHPTLNVILILTKESTVKVLDVYSGLVLQNSHICASAKSQVQCVYIPVHDKLLFTDGRSVGLRRDHNGVLLLDTVLQTRVGTASDVVRIELLLSEAIHLLKSLKELDVLNSEQADEVRRELEAKVSQKEAQTKSNHKVSKWSTVCLELPHNVLKSVCGALVQEFKRLNRYVPSLSIASAVGERLSYLVPPPLSVSDSAPTPPSGSSASTAVDRALMFSEAARRETFGKWPHMNYKWALPDQMAQAGFYHQANSAGDDRAMCFTCNICLVCWEPTDEPWSEHERHSPSCPFVKGEYTQNVPLSVTHASGSAVHHSDRIDTFSCVSTSSYPDLVATATENGNIVVWNVVKTLQKEFQFTVDLLESAIVRAAESRRRRVVDLAENDLGQSDSRTGGRNILSKHGVKLKRSNFDGTSSRSHYGTLDTLTVTSMAVVCSAESCCSSEGSSECEGTDGPIKPPSLVVGCSIRGSVARCCSSSSVRCVIEDNPLVQAKNDVNQAGSLVRSLDIMSLEEEVEVDGQLGNVSTSGFQERRPASPSSSFSSSASSTSGLYLLIYSLGSRRLPRVTTGCVGTESSVRRASGTRQDNGGCLFNMSLGALLDDNILVDPYGLNPFDSPPKIPNANDIQFGVSCPMHPTGGEENGSLVFPDISDTIVDNAPVVRKVKVDKKESQFGVRLVHCLELRGNFCGETHRVTHVVPTSDDQHLLVVVGRTEVEEGESKESADCFLFLYRLTAVGDYTTLEEVPVLTRTLVEAITRVVLLPSEVGDGRDESPSSASTLSKSPAGNASLGHAAVVTSCGRIEIVKVSTLETVGSMEPPSGDSFVDLAFCTSMERLCSSTSNGQMLLVQLWPKVVEARLSNDDTTTTRYPSLAVDGGEQTSNATANGPKYDDVGRLLVDRPLTATVLTSLHELTQFANLMPRFAATLPTCWTEIQQEQKQRRHPQHLQQQGEGQQHTRSWRLQCDSTTWDEHLLELTLPRPCSIGHIDLKFNLQPFFVSPPNIQVTLLKQNTCGICKMQDTSSGNESSPVTIPGTTGSVGRQEQGKVAMNPVVLPEFQEAHNAEILCGPLSLETRIDLSGQGGIVTFTSPELFKTKARTFLIHIKSLEGGDKERTERSGESSARSSVNLSKPFGGRHSNMKLKDKHGPVPSLQTLLEHTFQEYIPPKSAAEILAATAPGRKVDVPRGCNVLYEISVTVRTSKKCMSIGKEREQRVAMLENVSFQERLVSTLCGGDVPPSDITLEHRQHLVFDILNWIASIQSNGISTRTDIRGSVFAIIQSNLNSLILTCFLNGSRSISHKASKLIVLCTEFYKEVEDPSFEVSLTKALLNALPMMVACRSAGSMHWFFLLLDSVKFLDAASVSRECFALLVSVVEELDSRSHPMHGLLRARFGLYRNPFELELFEVEATQPPKPTSTPITYAAVVGNGGSASTSNNNNNNNNGTPGGGMVGVGTSSSNQTASGCHPKGVGSVGSTFLSEDGPGTSTSFNHPAQQLQGLLEVEPLHFVCNSASDGTKVERVDQGSGSSVNSSSLSNNNMTVYVPTAYDSSQISVVLKDMKKTEEELLKVLQQKQSIILQQQQSSGSSPYGTSSQPASKLTNSASISTAALPSTSASKQSPSTPINGLSMLPTCFQHFLQPPPQQVLVIERMHSGARRFVVLDFGKPVILTDLIIPACPDLVSLSIDIWTKGEEDDGRRLVVSTDIFFRSLVMSDLLPPPVCRYLKITAIGRYGMSTTRCRIPLGSFYGLTTLPPWVDADDRDHGLSEAESRSQLNMLSTFLEDVHCRYSLACDKLRSLLAPLLSYNRSTAGHIQAFVRGEREGTSGNEQRIYSAYRDCVQMQQQFGLISSTAERLQRWRTLPSTNPISLSPDPRHACTNKLGVLGECLLVTLLGMTFKSSCPPGSDPTACSNVLLPNLNEGMCKLLFRHLATVGSRRFQAMATALLVRTCGLCHWWGDFVAQLFVELYSSNQTAIFPQDRVFLLLVSRHDRSLLWNTMPSILELLEKLLIPILDSGNRSFGSVDLPLVGWVLLFISFYLDLAEGSGGSNCSLSDEGGNDSASARTAATKDKEGVCSRWDFIQEEWALLRNQSNQTKMASSRFYRKKLQKRLMYHKQQLEDLEQTKKEFIPSATFSMLKSHFGAKVAVDLNAAIKQQEQLFKKMLKQHTAKHFKDVVQIRRLEGGNLSRLVAGEGSNASGGGSTAGPSWERDDGGGGPDLKEPPLPLHRSQSLRVARGLAALLLCMDYTCNVDMFLLSCKILARIATLARPAIGLGEILSQSELQKLLWRSIGYQRAAGTPSWGGPWAGHAITCLLQDILEGERMFPIVSGNMGVGCSGGSSCGSPGSSSALISSDLSDIQQSSPAADSSTQFDGENNLVGLEKLLEVESDETSSEDVEITIDCNETTPKYSFAKKVWSDANKPLNYKNGGSSSALNALQDGLISVPCGSNASKLSVSTVSSAIDSRLEMGVEVVAELRLKTMAFFESDAFFSALFFPLLPPNDRPSQLPTMKTELCGNVNTSPFANSSGSQAYTSSSADMLCICFDNLFWQAKMPGVSLESLLQLWVSLNNETSSDPTTQILHLSANAASGLLDALAWYPTLSLRTWYLAFKVLLPFGGHQSTNVDVTSHSSSSDSSAKAIASSDVLLPVIVKFLSGTGLEYVSGTKLNVGPNVSGVVCDFLVRLMKNCHSLPSGFRAGIHLKEQLLRIVYLLLANNGPLRCGQGPLDAQCRFINLLLTVNFDCVDPHLQTSIVEAVASLVHFHVHTGRQITCRSSTESTVGDGTCFGGLFSVPLRNDLAGCSMEGTRSNLVHSLLSLCVRLVQTPCGKSPAANPPSSFLTDTFKMEQRSSMSSSSLSESGASSEPLQTDELKSSCPQVPTCGHTHALSSGLKPQYVAEDVLRHQPTMMFLLSTLASCTGSTMAMILGPVGIGASNVQQDGADRFVLGEPASVGDVVFQLLVTLNSKASELSSILRPVLAFLSCESVELDGRPKTAVTLSEPLLWFLIKILDCKQSLAEFLSLGGVEVVCRNLVSSYSTQVNCHPSLLSVIMQKMNRLMAPIVKGQWPNTDNVDGLINFAPLGTITSKDPTTMQPADILIQPTPPHRRARTPAWSYHFYPEDSWVELTITLPCAILLHEVHIQPHLTSLATCPSAVSLEVSADLFSRPKPLCPPHPTGGLTFIRLQLSRPEVTTSLMIRLYKPRDSSNVGLSQILLLGSSAFGEAVTRSSSLIVPTEESVAKSCIGWLRIVHHCLVHQCDVDVLAEMCRLAAGVPGLLHTCCSLLTSPAPELYATHIESVLLILGRHNARVGLQVINILLHTGGSPFRQGNCSWLMDRSQGGWSSVDSATDIIHLLCTTVDSDMIERVRALLNWLQLTTRAAIQHFKSRAATESTGSDPEEFGGVSTQAFVHCVAVTLWSLREAGFGSELEAMLDIDLFRSVYEWSAQLGSTSSTKWAVDAVLTSICHVCPNYFPALLEWMGFSVPPTAGEDAPITDDSKKEITINQATVSPGTPLSYEMIDLNSISAECLATVAAASQSLFVVEQLIRSRLPGTLAQAILDFCVYVGTAIGSRSSFDNGSSMVDHMTDSDKAGRSHDNNSFGGVGVVVTASVVSSILNFFTEACGEGTIRDWLGGPEGSIFWLPLVDLLCQPLSRLSGPSCQQTLGLTAQQRASLEAATIQFLSRCCWCHSDNQQLLAQVLCKVIGKQGVAGNQGGLPFISGFARRLVLQLLLENEKILVCVKSSLPLNGQLLSGCHWRHPRFGCGHRYRLLYASTQMTCSDLIASASSDSTASMSIMSETGEAAEAPRDDLGSIGLDLADYLSVAAGVLAKDKRHKETKGTNQSMAFHPSASRGGQHASNSFSSLPLSTMTLVHDMFPDHPLPRDLTLAQLLSALEDKGQSLVSPHVILTLQSQNQSKGSTETYSEPVADISKLLMGYSGFPSVLQVFASVGGLALMAQYLPVLYPDVNRISLTSSVGKANGCDDKGTGLCDVASNLEADWVKVEGPDDILDDFPDLMPLGSSTSRSLHATSMPPHSLAAFGLFLRLPGYAETLLRERQKALCLLRLALGVCDDGEGGDIFSSSVAPSLPTFPFQVLQRLFDSTPLTTDDGLLLRRMALDVGAIHLLLACLSILSHQNVDVSLATPQHEVLLAATRCGVTPQDTQSKSDDKSHLYWAKGTGFGTGSTAQSWDVEQAIMRQKSEEEHVTCLLLVLASFINPAGNIPEIFSSGGTDGDDDEICLDDDEDEDSKANDSQPYLLPSVFPELLSQSCLFASISSYLRNDSVLDMARHVPLYRALLLLLRALAVCNQLVGLLLPRVGRKSESDASGNMSVCCLLTKMKSCVDTYASHLRVNPIGRRGHGTMSRFVSMTKQEEEDSEGLALLIPDIQETARIVKLATERLVVDGVDVADDGSGISDRIDGLSIDRRFQKSIEDRYIEAMRRLQFDTFEMIVEDEDGTRFTIPHHFESNMRATGDHGHPSRARRLAQETVTLSTSLPLSYSSSVFVRCDQDRLDLMKVLITGPAETPYANGCFEFDVYFPPDYPNSPMLINLETTGHHTVRFNPNLYNDGKVCLSILNTWHGRPEEKWNSQTSSFLQVLVSIQSLILVQEPYFNEPGYERSRGTPSGQQSSREYDSNIRQATVKWAMLEQLRNPCPSFKEVVRQHFWMKRSEISEQCETWINEMEAQGRDRRTGRTVALNCQALKRHYALLKEEFSRMKPPSGLEDLVGNVNWTKPASQEEGGGGATAVEMLGAGGSSGADVVIAEFAQLVDKIDDSDSTSSSQENGNATSHHTSQGPTASSYFCEPV